MIRPTADARSGQVVIDLPNPQSSAGMKPAVEAASAPAAAARSRPAGASGFLPHRQPFLYLTAAMVSGILLHRWIEPQPAIVWALAVISVTLSIKLVIGNKHAADACLLLSFAMTAALLSTQDQAISESRLKRLFDKQTITPDSPVELEGVLRTPPEPGPQVYYLEVDAERLRIGEQLIPATGGARLMISLADKQTAREFEAVGLEYGSRMRVLVRLERARAYHNPGSPDFNEFLEPQGNDQEPAVNRTNRPSESESGAFVSLRIQASAYEGDRRELQAAGLRNVESDDGGQPVLPRSEDD